MYLVQFIPGFTQLARVFRGVATLIHIHLLKFIAPIAPVGGLFRTEHEVEPEAGGGQALQDDCGVPFRAHVFVAQRALLVTTFRKQEAPKLCLRIPAHGIVF